jgi:hypothetical protein
MIYDKAFRSQVKQVCQLYEDDSGENEVGDLPVISTDRLYADDWEFVKPEKVVSLGGKLTVDLLILFKEEDVRSLFDWQTKTFIKYCELIAGEYSNAEPHSGE